MAGYKCYAHSVRLLCRASAWSPGLGSHGVFCTHNVQKTHLECLIDVYRNMHQWGTLRFFYMLRIDAFCKAQNMLVHDNYYVFHGKHVGS